MNIRVNQRRIFSVIVALTLIFSFSITAFAASRTLSMTRVQQEKTGWCWAACSEMIGHYKNSNATRDQWDIVGYIKGTSYPNDGAIESEIVKAVKYASHDTVTYTNASTLSFSSHQTHIDNSNPIMVISYGTTSGHAPVCSGYKTSGTDNYLYIIDPWEDTATEYHLYTALVAGTATIQGGKTYQTSIYKK